MNLGDLEFKPEDFYEHIEDAVKFNSFQQLVQVVTNEANRILREKIAKAPEVFGYKDSVDCEWSEVESFPSTGLHRARLVAIEEIEK